ncbi:MAG TPA: hypothetical protein VJ124_11385 [Pyrinomonadaceae bacterium]|nr:hypothetical protein [Pyrinomonadaceae bacterium]
MTKKEQVLKLLEECTPDERLQVFKHLRKEIPLHPLEIQLNAQAELILEAMARSSDLTMRGLRGIIAESAFLVDVLQQLRGWQVIEIVGDAAYDFLIEDEIGSVSIQVKMQRKQKGAPFIRKGRFVVETQRTRGGRNKEGGATRPYRFGEFDILAVSLQPVTNNWTDFVYTVGTWLRSRPNHPHLLEVFQPLPQQPNDDWTNSLETCIRWFRSGERRTIEGF